MRRIYPQTPVLILRRSDNNQTTEDLIRGEFVLGESPGEKQDLEIVSALRKVLPIQPCLHVHKGHNYETVKEVVRVISEHYANPDLDLTVVAQQLPMSANQLSRILNQQVGISFRQLLRQTRIEEAKRMLASQEFSVKEVAARVGFSDSHYFSRSFKELTGVSASEYRAQDPIFG
jgi:two-component system response regulator YesN